jgi:hypothetical protein
MIYIHLLIFVGFGLIGYVANTLYIVPVEEPVVGAAGERGEQRAVAVERARRRVRRHQRRPARTPRACAARAHARCERALHTTWCLLLDILVLLEVHQI